MEHNTIKNVYGTGAEKYEKIMEKNIFLKRFLAYNATIIKKNSA